MNQPLDHDKLRRTACDLARIGADIARPLLGKTSLSRKSDDTPVTPADYLTQQAILTELSRRHPDHAILVEEDVADPQRHAALASADYCWVIDPIDGTRNFFRGVSNYATSVAVLQKGQPVAAAIHEAADNRLYSAASGLGAFRNDQPFRLEDRPIGADTTLALSSFRRKPMPPVVRGWLDRYLFRSFGSVCLHLVNVAGGFIDGAYSRECKLWDIAAAALIIEQAGGLITDETGKGLWPKDIANYHGEDFAVVAGTPVFHAALLRDLKSQV